MATPIDPFITLKDDALRLLRGLRFAAVFNLSLDPEFLNAAHEAVVRQRLATMVICFSLLLRAVELVCCIFCYLLMYASRFPVNVLAKK